MKVDSKRMKYGGRKKGTPNKITKEVKERLQNVLNECLHSIKPQNMTQQEKLKAVQICLQYLVPKPIHEGALESTISKVEIEIFDPNKNENHG